jgi:hypothetical protein
MRGFKDTLMYLRERHKQKGLLCTNSILMNMLKSMDQVEGHFQEHVKQGNCSLDLGERLCGSKLTGAVKLLLDFVTSPEIKNCKFFEPAIGISPRKLMPPPPPRAHPKLTTIAEIPEEEAMFQGGEQDSPSRTAARAPVSLEDELSAMLQSLQCPYCKREYKDKRYVRKHFKVYPCDGLKKRQREGEGTGSATPQHQFNISSEARATSTPRSTPPPG